MYESWQYARVQTHRSTHRGLTFTTAITVTCIHRVLVTHNQQRPTEFAQKSEYSEERSPPMTYMSYKRLTNSSEGFGSGTSAGPVYSEGRGRLRPDGLLFGCDGFLRLLPAGESLSSDAAGLAYLSCECSMYVGMYV
jgi:hypothetical protein